MNGLLVRLQIKVWCPEPKVNFGKMPMSFPESDNILKSRDLRSKENAARRNLDEFSLQTSWGNFVPMSIYKSWINSDEKLRLEFIQIAEAALNEYDATVAQLELEARTHLDFVPTTPTVELQPIADLRRSLKWNRRFQAPPWVGLRALALNSGCDMFDCYAIETEFNRELRVAFGSRLLAALPGLSSQRLSDPIALAALRRIEQVRLIKLPISPALDTVLTEVSKECREDWLHRDEAKLRELCQNAQKLVGEEFNEN